MGEEFGAVRPVPLGHGGGDLGGQGAGEREVRGLDDGDGAAGPERGGGELGADPAGTDDHDGVPALQDGPEAHGVVEGAEQVDAGDALGAGQGDRVGAGGDDQDVVRDGSGLGVDLAVGGAQPGDVHAEPEFDAQVLEVDVEGGVLGLPEEDRLGERGPVVGLVGLGPDEGHGAGEALLAEGDGGLDARHPGADDHDAPLGLLLLAHTATLCN